MKTLLTVTLIVMTQIAANADEKDAVGRYQLIFATTETFSLDGKNEEEKTVWKIDTVTGQVWQFHSVITPGKQGALHEEFVPITTDKP
jgi:hypothetical protein